MFAYGFKTSQNKQEVRLVYKAKYVCALKVLCLPEYMEKLASHCHSALLFITWGQPSLSLASYRTFVLNPGIFGTDQVQIVNSSNRAISQFVLSLKNWITSERFIYM